MATITPFLFLLPLFFQNIFCQLVPVGNGCFCQKSSVPQNQLINLQIPNPGCNCPKNLPFNNQPLNNLPINQLPVVNGLQINNGPINNRPPFTNVPNVNLHIGNLPFIPVNNVPVYNNIPLANLPVVNNVPFGNNVPLNLPLNGLQINNFPNNRLPAFNNIQLGNLPVRNNLPVQNSINYLPNFPVGNNLPMPTNIRILPNIPIGNNLPPNCINSNGMPINLPNCVQVPNANQVPMMPFPNNLPANNINPGLQNYNVMPVNNFPPNNVQIANLQMSQPNNIQFTNAPNGLHLNQLPNGVNNQQSFQNVPVNNEYSHNQPGVSVLVENGLASSSGNAANNAPVVSMNGLQLGGLGGLGNLPLFNGLPVIGVQESVVNLNNQCTCQN